MGLERWWGTQRKRGIVRRSILHFNVFLLFAELWQRVLWQGSNGYSVWGPLENNFSGMCVEYKNGRTCS